MAYHRWRYNRAFRSIVEINAPVLDAASSQWCATARAQRWSRFGERKPAVWAPAIVFRSLDFLDNIGCLRTDRIPPGYTCGTIIRLRPVILGQRELRSFCDELVVCSEFFELGSRERFPGISADKQTQCFGRPTTDVSVFVFEA